MTPEELAARLEDLRGQISDPRKLVAGHMAWEIIKSALMPEGWAHVDAHTPITHCFGMPVHIDQDMPACAWKIVETDLGSDVERVIAEHDFAPGFQHAVHNPVNGQIYVYNLIPDTVEANVPLPTIFDETAYWARRYGRWPS